MTENGIILFHYTYSPFARRVVWYLTLRGLEYSQCLQPVVLPRDDISALGLSYRRIPVLSIVRDIYYDTRLIIKKLEETFPEGALGAKVANEKALEQLLDEWTVNRIFPQAAVLIPTTLPIFDDPKFIKDREDFAGRSWKKDDVERMRPEAVVEIRAAFDFLETTLLSDGRTWIIGSEKVSLADIETIWPFHWLNDLPNSALPTSLISAALFPRVFAWISRSKGALSAARSSFPKPTNLSGNDALARICGSNYVSANVSVADDDPLQLKAEQQVELWPTDTGVHHRDRGSLVGLTQGEITLECPTKMAEQSIRVHAPRHGFRVRAVSQVDSARL